MTTELAPNRSRLTPWILAGQSLAAVAGVVLCFLPWTVATLSNAADSVTLSFDGITMWQGWVALACWLTLGFLVFVTLPRTRPMVWRGILATLLSIALLVQMVLVYNIPRMPPHAAGYDRAAKTLVDGNAHFSRLPTESDYQTLARAKAERIITVDIAPTPLFYIELGLAAFVFVLSALELQRRAAVR